jgi:hypothetical protein
MSEAALQLYKIAREFVSIHGFDPEVEWQRSLHSSTFDESQLLREAAWVILCTGYRESILRKKFGFISLCFCDWESASEIVSCEPECRATALAAFNNNKKIDAIVRLARTIATTGFERLKVSIHHDPIQSLQTFSYIGPVTAWHLAKNLGFDVAKPDRHLCRMSERLGYTDVHNLCDDLSQMTGEEKKVVDIVLWRYAAEVGAEMLSVL